jgi:EmrB/QacA subfamily drug resistance transporter
MTRGALSPNYRWVVLSIITIGVFMASVDTAVVVLALPDMMTDLHANLVSMTWVLMVYTFVGTVFLLALGRVGDMFGRIRLYNMGFVIFTLGSVLCGLAHAAWLLVASRVIQGGGGALMLVNAWAIITEVFPASERGLALGINSLIWGLGGVVGPVLGGLILAAGTWRWIFFINIPIGVGGSIAGYLILRERSRPATDEKLDVLGALSFSAALFGLLYALTQGIESGWTSPAMLSLFALFLVGIAFFIFWEKTVRHPALDLSLFDSLVFDFSILASMFQAIAAFSVQFLLVFYFQAVKGYSAIHSAFLLMPLPVAIAFSGPFSGKISDRIGSTIPATAGVLLQAAGIFILSTVGLDAGYARIALGLALSGAGGGFFFSPNTSAAMGAAKKNRLGVASAALATLRNTGMVISYALALAIAAGSIPKEVMMQLFVGTSVTLGSPVTKGFVRGMHAAFHASVVMCLIAAAMSMVGRQRRHV